MYQCSHVQPQTFSKANVLKIAVKLKSFLHASLPTNPLSLKLILTLLRDFYSFQLKNCTIFFLNPKLDKKVINSSTCTKCLIPVKISVLLISYHPLPAHVGECSVDSGCQKASTSVSKLLMVGAFTADIGNLFQFY